MRSRTVGLAGMVAAALVAAACGGDGGDPLAGVPADAPVAILDVGGGFVPVEHELTRLPQVVVYGDGTVLAGGAGDGSVSALELPRDELDELARFLDGADLGRFPENVEPEGPVTIADAPATTIEVRLASGSHRVSAYALGFEGLDYPDVLEEVGRRLQALGDRAHADGGPWTPDRGRLMVTGPTEGGGVPADAWPDGLPVPDGLGSALPHDPATMTLERDAVEAALVTFSQTPIRPLVAPDGQAYLVAWRPLLPHEEA